MAKLHAGWFAFLALAALALAAAGCTRESQGARETRDVSGFDSVRFSTSGQLIITQGDRESLVVEASAADLPRLVTEVNGGMLSIRREGPSPLFPLRPPVFHLTVKQVSGLETSSSGRISARGLQADALSVRISSSGGVVLSSLAADSLQAVISSSGELRVTGKVDRQDVVLSSSGGYSGEGLESRTARVRASSSGSATVRVSESLEAAVTSSGDVRYYGSPAGVQGNVTSSGRLVRLGN